MPRNAMICPIVLFSFQTLKGLIERAEDVNWASVIIAIVCILVLVANNEFLKVIACNGG